MMTKIISFSRYIPYDGSRSCGVPPEGAPVMGEKVYKSAAMVHTPVMIEERLYTSLWSRDFDTKDAWRASGVTAIIDHSILTVLFVKLQIRRINGTF